MLRNFWHKHRNLNTLLLHDGSLFSSVGCCGDGVGEPRRGAKATAVTLSSATRLPHEVTAARLPQLLLSTALH